MDKYTGKRLDGRYEIYELIGVGGMALVYRAYDSIDDRIVAIKILKDEFLGNSDFMRRFRNESKAIAVLSHENIVKVYDVSFGDKIQYIVMEYIDGITLKEYIEQQKHVKWKEAVYFVNQILKALKHAHEKGIVHRDIKPQNILLLQDGTIKVTDFGIARFAKSETRTMTDKAIGSVHYIAPEQARGSMIDEKADIYSVGVMLYEMLTGKLPFEADSAVSVAIMQLQNDPQKPREINPDIPEGLEEITLKAMQKDPNQRYASAEDMLLDIERFRRDPSIKFEYKYFNDENPTKYMDAINIAKYKNSDTSYGDGYQYEEDEQKKRKNTNIIIGGIMAAVAIVALVFGIMAIFKSCSNNSSKDVEVPDFIGMSITEVQGNSQYKFNWNIEYSYDSTKAEGIIIDQDPKAGSKKVKEDATIKVVVNSSGTMVTVPTLVGLTENEAKSRLSSIGLEYEVLTVSDDETASGVINSTIPQEGASVVVGSKIKIFVSSGPSEKKVTVPDVINKTLSAAKNELTSKGLKVSDDIRTEDSEKSKDTVIATNPLPGVEVSEGSYVTLTVSSGRQREKTIPIYVDLPSSVNYKVTITSYIDGVFNTSQQVLPAYNATYTLNITGTSGTKMVNVDIDGKQYRVYKVNFDSSSNDVTTVAKYDFVPSTSSKNEDNTSGNS